MKNFGYTITKGRQIDFESNVRKIAEYIFEREPSFRLCIECGCCAATCTTANFTKFSLRELNILIKRGENDLVQRSIGKCMLCGKCSLVCPRGVNTRNVLVLAKQAFHKTETDAI